MDLSAEKYVPECRDYVPEYRDYVPECRDYVPECRGVFFSSSVRLWWAMVYGDFKKRKNGVIYINTL